MTCTECNHGDHDATWCEYVKDDGNICPCQHDCFAARDIEEKVDLDQDRPEEEGDDDSTQRRDEPRP